MSQERIPEGKKAIIHKKEQAERDKHREDGATPKTIMADLQKQVGNRAVQRLLAQRSGEGAYELDDDTANRINQERSGGQALDSGVQRQMGESLGYDFSGVQVHTSPEADTLSQDIGAKAFTTGTDIFFREGAYDPGSSGGQELIAHELTHVVQQGTGAVDHGGGMMVNAPGDAFEQEADTTAKAALSGETAAGVQRQEIPEEDMQAQTDEELPEEELQRQEDEEDEIVAPIQMQEEIPEEEFQRQEELPEEELEEEEPIQAQEELPEEEFQRQEDEEDEIVAPIQMQEEIPEEEI